MIKHFEKLVATLGLTLAICLSVSAQQPATENHVSTSHNSHGMKGSHRLTFGLGHTQLSEGKIDGKTQWVPVGSWSLNYDYWLNDKWAIGLQNDLILETFIIEHGNEEEIERRNPISIIPVGMYKFSNRWSAILGVGLEFSEGQNLALTRLGVEYGLHLPKSWEVGVAAVWDGKWGYYNSWGIAFTFSKIWPEH